MAFWNFNHDGAASNGYTRSCTQFDAIKVCFKFFHNKKVRSIEAFASTNKNFFQKLNRTLLQA